MIDTILTTANKNKKEITKVIKCDQIILNEAQNHLEITSTIELEQNASAELENERAITNDGDGDFGDGGDFDGEWDYLLNKNDLLFLDRFFKKFYIQNK